MADRISPIEDALLATLRAANPAIQSSNIETRNIPLSEDSMKEIIARAPFIYVEYSGGGAGERAESGALMSRQFNFSLFIASKSLRSQKEGQRGSYDLLDKCFDALNGARLSDTGWSGTVRWTGETIFYYSKEGGTVYEQTYVVDGNP